MAVTEVALVFVERLKLTLNRAQFTILDRGPAQPELQLYFAVKVQFI